MANASMAGPENTSSHCLLSGWGSCGRCHVRKPAPATLHFLGSTRLVPGTCHVTKGGALEPIVSKKRRNLLCRYDLMLCGDCNAWWGGDIKLPFWLTAQRKSTHVIGNGYVHVQIGVPFRFQLPPTAVKVGPRV